VAEFSLEVWRTRAAERLRRAPRARKAVAGRRFKRDTKFINGLATLIDWCQKQGYSVQFGRMSGGGELDSESKTLKVSSHLSPERQFYIAVHECGHLLIGDRKKTERFGMGYNADDPNEKKTFHHRIDVIDEEFEAWDRGRKLAGRLGVRIDKKRFHKFRAEYLKTYLKWALKVDGYGEDDGDKT